MADESSVYALVLGQVIARLRARKRWSQAQLSARIGVAQSSLSRFETGASMPDAFTYRRLAQAFGMTVAELQDVVDRSLERTRRTAHQAAPPDEDPEWWQVALGVAGVAGFAGLIAFAVSAAINDDEEGDA